MVVPTSKMSSWTTKLDKIQSSLKMIFFVSTLLYLLGKSIGWAMNHIIGNIFKTPNNTMSTTHKKSSLLTLQIPVPFIDIKKLFGSSSHDDSSSQPRRIKGQYTVEYLNSVGRKIDFLHQNYTRYLNKITQGNQTMMMSSSVATPTRNESTFQKRIYPIVFKHKYGLAKDILMRDLFALIEKCQLRSEMYRQQIKTISRFIPPSFFLLDPKLSPYYWVLTDIDYKLMPSFLRNFLLYTNTSTVGTTNSNTGFNNFTTSYSQLQFPNSYNNTAFGSRNSMLVGSVLPPHILDRIRYDWKFFVTQNRSISHRFEYLYNAFLNKQGITINNKQERNKYLREFENECHKLLKKRRKVARKKIKTVRMKHLRPSEREKSQLKAQFNKLKQLELSSNIV